MGKAGRKISGIESWMMRLYICIVIIYISVVYCICGRDTHTSVSDGTDKCLYEENLLKSIDLPVRGESLSVWLVIT